MVAAKAQSISSKQSKHSKKAKTAQHSQISILSEEKVIDSDSDADRDIDSEDHEIPDSSLETANEPIVRSQQDKGKIKEVVSQTTSEEESETESEQDSETDDTETNELSKAKVSVAKLKGTKRKASDEDVESTSEEESDVDDQRMSKKARVDKNEHAGLDKQNGTFNDSVAEKNGKKKKGKDRVPSVVDDGVQDQENDERTPLPTITATPYTAPEGYRGLPMDEDIIFEESQFEDMELWHITAPKSVPIESIRSLAPNAIEKQLAILSHRGMDYVLYQEQDIPPISLFLPKKSRFAASSRRLSRSLSLRARLDIPVIPSTTVSRNSGSAAAANIATPAIASISAQPDGLRMRFKPPAFGKGKPGTIGGTSSEEDDDTDGVQNNAPTFQFPRALGPHPDGDTVKNSIKNKSKKDKHKDSVQQVPNGLAEHFEPTPRATSQPESLDAAATKFSTVDSQSQTLDDNSLADEAARLKAERQARKLAKKQARGLA